MKKENLINAIILAGVFLLFGVAMANPRSIVKAVDTPKVEDCNTSRTIQVSGTGVIYVTPDRVLIDLGLQSTGVTPDAAQVNNLNAVQKVTAAIHAVGVDPKDIATDGYIVYPVYDDGNSLVIKGYRIDHTVSITLRDISKVADVLIAAFKAGANEVQNVQFYTSELRKYRDQARSLAMKAAGEKAQALAVDGGAQAGYLMNASENSWSRYYGSWGGGRDMALWTQNAIQNANVQTGSPASDDTLFSLGQIAVQADVFASYSLK